MVDLTPIKLLDRAAKMPSLMGSDMQRREFISLIGGGAAAWPFTAIAQQAMPARGWLIIDGGGEPEEVKRRFVELAGGPDANFVLIPTALSDEQIEKGGFFSGQGRGWARSWGIHDGHVAMLHSRDKARANSDSFIDPLRKASGVWIMGGRQWRLADAYLDTAVERQIKELLARGGVVGGSSAGASIQASFLVRGDSATPGMPDGDNRIMIGNHQTGFALLPNSAIDQHVNARGREQDLVQVIQRHPELLGIGIDEGAAIVVHSDSFQVIGNGRIAIHDGQRSGGNPYYFLTPGQTFDLRK
jgi:cyanophycinase